VSAIATPAGSDDAHVTTETEWGVRFHAENDVVAYGTDARDQALNVARIYGHGTPESKVSIVSRTVTYGPWIAEPS